MKPVMKITLLQENLLDALRITQKGLARKPQLPILASFLLTVQESNLTLSATDLFMGITTTVRGGDGVDGSIAVPGKQFFDIIATLPAGKVTLSLTENQLLITTTRSKSTIQVLPATEFPAFPEVGKTDLVMPLSLLDEVLQLISFASSNDETRPILTSVLFNLQSKSEIVATDGFRLALLKPNLDFEEMILQVPNKALRELHRIASIKKISDVVWHISTEQKQVAVSMDDVTMYVRLVDGEFPPYSKIIPQDLVTTGTFDAGLFEQLLKAVQVFAREGSNIVTLTFTQEEIQFSAVSPSLGKHESSMPWQALSGDGGTIAFNVTYLLEFFITVKVNTVWFGMNNSLQPAIFRPEDQKNYQYIVMPFKLNE